MQQLRPPIIVILGHVDHGKTTLLDYLRHSHIADREAGGITQHIRSFQLVTPNSQPLTFIDTPGHAAFSAMRQRGSRLADIAILIVAGDDGVMPQTQESIKFITASNLPYIVAVTKADLPAFDPDRVKTQLTEAGVVVEDYGGPVPSVNVSAKTGQGIPELLDMLQLMASLDPPQADPQAILEAVVLESRLDSHKGPLATVIVKNGTLSLGQNLFTHQPVGKVRSLTNSDAQSITSAPPSMPVEILGLSQVVPVGSVLSTQSVTQQSLSTSAPNTASAGTHNLIIKADVAGSLEAILASFGPEVKVISGATGDISENDVLSARASSAQILGFNVKVPHSVQKLADIEHVSIKTYKIIYELLEDLDHLLHPVNNETVLGKANILADFKINSDRIAGCKVTDGQISKADKIRLQRGDAVIGETRIKSLKLGKSDTQSVKTGQEFGAVFSPYLDFKPGDYIIAFDKPHGQT